MDMLKVTFPGKFMTMNEIILHIELATSITEDSQLLQYSDGRVFFDSTKYDRYNFVPEKFFDTEILIVNTKSAYNKGNTPDIVKYLKENHKTILPKTPNFRVSTWKRHYTYLDDEKRVMYKHTDLKLALYERFNKWPYLLDEISDELNRDHKSNGINYNPKLMYYWENTAYITPRVVNDKVALIILMTKTQIFDKLKTNSFAYYRSHHNLEKWYKYNEKEYSYETVMPFPSLINDVNMEFRDIIVCSRYKYHKQDAMRFRRIGSSDSKLKTITENSFKWNEYNNSPFAAWFDIGTIFQPAAAQPAKPIPTKAKHQKWLGDLINIKHSHTNSINPNNSEFLYSKEMILRALNNSQLVVRCVCPQVVCNLILEYASSSQYLIDASTCDGGFNFGKRDLFEKRDKLARLKLDIINVNSNKNTFDWDTVLTTIDYENTTVATALLDSLTARINGVPNMNERISLATAAIKKFDNYVNDKNCEMKHIVLSHSLILKTENIFEIKCVEPPMAVLIPPKQYIKKGWHFKFGIYCKKFKCELGKTELFQWGKLHEKDASKEEYHEECITCHVNRLSIECYINDPSIMVFEQNLSLDMENVKIMYPKIRLSFRNSIASHFLFVAEFDVWNEKTKRFERIHESFIDTSYYDCNVIFGSSACDSKFLFTRIK